MTQTMTQQQFDAYLEATGNGISSENGNVAFISNMKGDVVAMYWRGNRSYLETLEEPVREEEVSVNTIAFDTNRRKEAILATSLTVFIFTLYALAMAFIG